MDDAIIIDLYFARSESAINETEQKYGAYCHTIASNILRNNEDAEECVNDTYIKIWENIPPERPKVFCAFLGKITRNIALNKYKERWAKKRGGDFALVFDELEECLPSVGNVEDEFDAKEAGNSISEFLLQIGEENRLIFVRRYWYGDSVQEITERFGMSNSKVKSILFRTRNKLKQYLEQGGVII